MCVTELWQYRDCGCDFEYFVPCQGCPEDDDIRNNGNAIYADVDEEDGITARFRGEPYHHSRCRVNSDHSNPLRTPPNPNPTASAHPTQPSSLPLQKTKLRTENVSKAGSGSLQKRDCSVHHVVHRTFLEPVCDECGLVEQLRAFGVYSTSNNEEGTAQSCQTKAEIGPDNEADLGQGRDEKQGGSLDARLDSGYGELNNCAGDGRLILESNVEIEIVPERYSEESIGLDLGTEASHKQSVNDTFDRSRDGSPRPCQDGRGRGRASERSLGSEHTLTTPSPTSAPSASASSSSGSRRGCSFVPDILQEDDDADADADDELSLCNPTPKPSQTPAIFGSQGNCTNAIFEPILRSDDIARSDSRLQVEGNEDSLAPLNDNVTITKRGRLRTRSKELRRRGMDISREELRLRIASAWSSGEKKDMRAFREQLKSEGPVMLGRIRDRAEDGEEEVMGEIVIEKTEDRAAQRTQEARGRVSVSGWARGIAGRVGRSLGRGSRGRKQRTRGAGIGDEKEDECEESRVADLSNDSALLRSPEDKVHRGPETTLGFGSDSSNSVNTVFEYDGDSFLSQNRPKTPSSVNGADAEEHEIPEAAFTAAPTWEQHLREDLGMKYHGTKKAEQTQSGPRGCKEDLHFDSGDLDEVQMRRRLLSESTSAPSLPSGTSGADSEGAWWSSPTQPLNLSSGEFESDGNSSLVGNCETYGGGVRERRDEEVTSIDDHTSIATRSLHGHGYAHAVSMSSTGSYVDSVEADSGSTSPRNQHAAGAAALSLHPLSTSIRHAASVRPPAHPQRGSSLLSPPAGSSYRVPPESGTGRLSKTGGSAYD